MTTRDAALDRAYNSGNLEKACLLRKANQEWEMAGLVRQDNDHPAVEKHTAEARRLQQEASEL